MGCPMWFKRLTCWGHHSLFACLTPLADSEIIFIVSLALQNTLSAKATSRIFVIEGDPEWCFGKAGAGGLGLQLLLRIASLVNVNILLVVVGGQHFDGKVWE